MTMNAEELYSALDSIKTALTVNTKNVWDVADLAAYLKVSESRIRHRVAAGEIPSYRRQGRVYFRREEIEEWLTEHPQTTTDAVARKEATRRAIKTLENSL